jgi:DNA-directed RNA polymerase subunit RPC12/RpoP
MQVCGADLRRVKKRINLTLTPFILKEEFMIGKNIFKNHIITNCQSCGSGVPAALSGKEYRMGMFVNCRSCGTKVLFKKGNEIGELTLLIETLKVIGWGRLLVLLGIAVGATLFGYYYLGLYLWLSIILSALPLAYHWTIANLKVLKGRFGS